MTIQVPAGQTCHFFAPLFGGPAVNVQVGSKVVNNIFIYGGEEFSGPATLTSGGDVNLIGVVSYYLTDDAVNLPSGLLQGPTGSFVITVEKSTDLTHWFPVMIQATGQDQSAFYRLNFSH